MVKAATLVCLFGLLPSTALAQTRLAVNDCGGAHAATWACDANTRTAVTLVASVSVADPVVLVGHESLLDFDFSQSVPDWWRCGIGGCRPSSALGLVLDGTSTTCVDPISAVGSPGFSTAGYVVGPSADAPPYGALDDHRTTLWVLWEYGIVAWPGELPAPASGELYLFTLRIDRTRATGADACAGCEVCVVARLRQSRVSSPIGLGPTLFATADGPLSEVSLQGGSMSGGVAVCPGTPAGRTSWGQVKSLYR